METEKTNDDIINDFINDGLSTNMANEFITYIDNYAKGKHYTLRGKLYSKEKDKFIQKRTKQNKTTINTSTYSTPIQKPFVNFHSMPKFIPTSKEQFRHYCNIMPREVTTKNKLTDEQSQALQLYSASIQYYDVSESNLFNSLLQRYGKFLYATYGIEIASDTSADPDYQYQPRKQWQPKW